MEKRYQVFISSTFVDLEEERKKVMEAIINLNCFPAGMEMFPATDTEQFEYIKSIIDESDYYVIVVAAKYGSVAEDGISYTEKEFDYAMQKGIPILGFVKKDIITISGAKIETDPIKKKKLDAFRERVLTGRVAKLWDSADELKYSIHNSLSNEFKIHPMPGWIRGNQENNEELLKQINELRIENEKISNIAKKSEKDILEDIDLFNKLNKEFAIYYISEYDQEEEHYREMKTSLILIIENIGAKLLQYIDDNTLRKYINQFVIEPKMDDSNVFSYHILDKSLEEIKMKLLVLKIILLNSVADLKLSEFGEKVYFDTIKF